MNRILIPFFMLAIIGGPMAAQGVTWTVFPDPAPTQQILTLTLKNQSGGTISLTSSAPWSIYDNLGKLVFTPVGLPVAIQIPDNNSMSYNWNQTSQGKFIPPGPYEARMTFYDKNRLRVLLKAPFQIEPDLLTITGTPIPGATLTLGLASPNAPTLAYQMACALGMNPGLLLAGNRRLDLTPDHLFLASIQPGLPVFRRFAGFLDAQGTATAALAIPNASVMRGVTVYLAYITLHGQAPGNVFSYSATQTVTIQ